MNLPKIPEKDITPEDRAKIDNFRQDLLDLCNKHRIAIVVGSMFLMKDEESDGKLLDLAGWTYNQVDKLRYPVFVDRNS